MNIAIGKFEKAKKASALAAVIAELERSKLGVKERLKAKKEEIGTSAFNAEGPNTETLSAQLRVIEDEAEALDAQLKEAGTRHRAALVSEAEAEYPRLWDEIRNDYLHLHELAQQASNTLKNISARTRRLSDVQGLLNTGRPGLKTIRPHSMARRIFVGRHPTKSAPNLQSITVGPDYSTTPEAEVLELMRELRLDVKE